MLLNEHKPIFNSQKYCVACATMQTTIRNCCTNTKRVTTRYTFPIVTCAIITTINGSRLKNNGQLTVMTDKSRDRPISELPLSCSNKHDHDNEFCDVTLGSVDGQKFKAHKVTFSSSSIFFKILLVDKKNHHPLICLRGIEIESHLLHSFTLKKQNLKETRWSPL